MDDECGKDKASGLKKVGGLWGLGLAVDTFPTTSSLICVIMPIILLEEASSVIENGFGMGEWRGRVDMGMGGRDFQIKFDPFLNNLDFQAPLTQSIPTISTDIISGYESMGNLMGC